MKTTAFEQRDAKGKVVEPSDDQKALHLLMRTKGWSRTIAEGFCKTLDPDELKALTHLEDAPSLTGDEVNIILDEIEDRQAKEAAEKKAAEEKAKAAEPAAEEELE
jgi:hypothetical protein